MTASTIDPRTQIRLIDTHTGETLKTSTYAQRRRMRATADRKDLAYGAVRYRVAIDFDILAK